MLFVDQIFRRLSGGHTRISYRRFLAAYARTPVLVEAVDSNAVAGRTKDFEGGGTRLAIQARDAAAVRSSLLRMAEAIDGLGISLTQVILFYILKFDVIYFGAGHFYILLR